MLNEVETQCGTVVRPDGSEPERVKLFNLLCRVHTEPLQPVKREFYKAILYTLIESEPIEEIRERHLVAVWNEKISMDIRIQTKIDEWENEPKKCLGSFNAGTGDACIRCKQYSKCVSMALSKMVG